MSNELPQGFVLDGPSPAAASPPPAAKTAGPGLPSGFVLDPSSVMNDVGEQKDSAGFWTRTKAAIVDDPETKIRIMAKARGIPVERYGIRDGKIGYLGDDGKFYPEVEPTLPQAAVSGIAEMAGHAPDIAGGVAGAAAGGIPGAAAGSGAGTAVRKGIGSVFFDEPRDLKSDAKDIGFSALIGGAAEVPGWALGKYLSRNVARDIGRIDWGAVDDLVAKGKAAGVDLTPAELTNLRSLREQQNSLGKLPRSGDIIDDFMRMRGEQIEGSYNKFLETVSKLDPETAAGKAVSAAEGAISDMDTARTAAATPKYQEAFKSAQPVNVQPVLSEIDDMLSGLPKGSTSYKKLSSYRNMLADGATSPPDIMGARAGGQLQQDLRIVDTVKQEMDNLIQGIDPDAQSVLKGVKYRLDKVRGRLVELGDAASPGGEYKGARGTYESMSPAIDEARSGITGRLAAREGDDVTKATRDIFNSGQTSPASVRRAKDLIQAKDPEAWNGIVRSYLQDVFENSAKSGGTNKSGLGTDIWRKLGSSVKQRQVIDAALDGPQKQGFADLLDVLEATGRAAGGESVTATRQIGMNEMRNESLPSLYKAGKGVMTLGKSISQLYEDLRFGKYSEELANIITSPDAMAKLKQLKQMSPRDEAFISGMSELLGYGGYRFAGTRLGDMPIGQAAGSK